MSAHKLCLQGQIVYVPSRDNLEGIVFPNHELYSNVVNNIVKTFSPKTELEPVEVNIGANVVSIDSITKYLKSTDEGKMVNISCYTLRTLSHKLINS